MKQSVFVGTAEIALKKLSQGDFHFLKHPIRSYRNRSLNQRLCNETLARWPGIDTNIVLQKQACAALVSHLMDFVTLEELRGFLTDFERSGFGEEIIRQTSALRENASEKNPGMLSNVKGGGVFLYLLARSSRPKVVVETGVANGESSAHILQALEHNGQGNLYSIDLPPQHGEFGRDFFLPANLEVGWLVPERLRSRWSLTLGPAQVELPKLLEGIPKVDLFFHDSLHTYDHMMWEYETAWSHLSSPGLLVSDDVNSAFFDFLKRHRAPFVNYFSLAALRK